MEPCAGTSGAAEETSDAGPSYHGLQKENVSEDQYTHFSKLQFFCRVCGQVRVDKRDYLVAEHKTELLTLMSINTEGDEQNIHPQLMCKPCFQRLQRQKIKKKK